ncbi:MAG: HNH endonuclease [Proteobacteria bacterium]|nr:HNH endonuclease [Pseudomonadota bacterium]
MDTKTVKNLFDHITMWKRGGQRAPHKPLLILIALAHCIQEKGRLISFSDIENQLKQILIEFGPTRKRYHPEYPFWRLQNDGIWELTNTELVTSRRCNSDAKKGELIKYNVQGGFKKQIYDFLVCNKDQIPEIVSSILENNFPASIHEDILQAVGLDLEFTENIKRNRDPNFRDRILNAYEYRCAVCGFNVRVGNSLVALEAAHIKWHQAGGPDIEENGVALCALHHKLFDRGAFTLSDNMKIIVSDRAHGTGGFEEWLMAYHGKKLIQPQRPSFFPEPQFVSWHIREVFQGDGRHPS